MTTQWKDELALYEDKDCRVNMGHSTKHMVQFEIENKFLLRQNELLQKELMLTRYTIQALKDMVKQKNTTLDQTKKDLERSMRQIECLTWSLKQNGSFSSDDSEEEEDDELLSPPKFDIKSKLPIRTK